MTILLLNRVCNIHWAMQSSLWVKWQQKHQLHQLQTEYYVWVRLALSNKPLNCGVLREWHFFSISKTSIKKEYKTDPEQLHALQMTGKCVSFSTVPREWVKANELQEILKESGSGLRSGPWRWSKWVCSRILFTRRSTEWRKIRPIFQKRVTRCFCSDSFRYALRWTRCHLLVTCSMLRVITSNVFMLSQQTKLSGCTLKLYFL